MTALAHLIGTLLSTPRQCLIYLLYGLAFICLGVAISVKNMKGSNLRIAGSLYLLAGFGFVHGLHEWLELYLLLQSPYISTEMVNLVKALMGLSLALSFFLLWFFGISLTGFKKMAFHLRLLRQAGLIYQDPDRAYHLSPEGKRLTNLLQWVEDFLK